MSQKEDTKKVYWVRFQAVPDIADVRLDVDFAMMPHRRAVPFEVLEENDLTLRIKILENEFPDTLVVLSGSSRYYKRVYNLGIPKKGDELIIASSYPYGGEKLTERLQSPRTSLWYKSNIGGHSFSGLIFSYNPNEKE